MRQSPPSQHSPARVRVSENTPGSESAMEKGGMSAAGGSQGKS
jgi:hypothetical protein